MISIALISSPLSMEARYGKFSIAGNTQPTFALVCLASVAEQEEANVHIIDAAAEGLTIESVLQEVLEIRPDIVGVSSTTAGIVSSGKLALMIKSALPETITVIGGCHVTAIPEDTLQEFPGFDLAVIGEGEETFREIIRSAKVNKRDSGAIAGTAVRQNGSIHVQPRRAFIQHMDSLPLPAWRLLRGFPKAFHPTPTRIKRYPCASVVFTRGCPNQCLFCDRSVFGNKVRSYSTDHTISIIKDLRYNFGVREILIEDDTFVISRKRVEDFCMRIIDEKIDITWSCLGRADSVTPDILKLMRRAGCWHISFGIESGDQKILDSMHKRERLADVGNAVLWSHEAGLKTTGFFILGFPGETKESLLLTRNLALKLPLDDISVMRMTPFPGTAVYNDASKHGTFENDWEKMNVLNAVFIPHGLSLSKLDDASDQMLKAFYLRPRIVVQKMLDVMFNMRLLIPMLKGLLAFVRATKKS